MTLLWDADPGAVERFQVALGGVTRHDSPAALGRALEADSSEFLVIIGPDVDLASACDFSEGVRVQRPEVGVILTRRRVDVTVLAQSLRAGVREVVQADDLTSLADAARRSREISQKVAGHTTSDASREGKVITVFSAKGGVGKTTFSTNIAAYLATSGSKVLLVDLDLAFGDVAISLQMLPTTSIMDLVSMAGHIDEQGLASVVTHHSSGLDAAAAPSDPSDADRIPGSTISELLRVAKTVYDFVIIDTPPAFTEHVLAAFDNSDLLVLIATLDIPAVKNLRLSLDTLDLLGTPKDSRLVVLNRSDAKVGLRAEDVVTAIRQDIALMVPTSPAVPASVNKGIPLVIDEPRHAVSVAFKELTEKFLRNPGPVETRAEAKVDAGPQRRWSLSRGGK
ncbi:AAA family ATPase [Phycicoccus sp. M110.8]|uniref:AAA family ATPase n=1 Tax=Phycicoccus sp. M110.8 TaxID=3075433 RepID=UPI0028FD1ACF|nr:AAA family ATPase [Phycicoccus sp. M110.8]MDU0312659.1 AAA family ATPase [Phycicoccus sp. M110.8]